jgi:hypothetical protein
MIYPGDIVSYLEMCADFGINLQRGMNFRLRNGESVILMSIRPGAPYEDRVEQGGKTILYEGHDISRKKGGPDPQTVDQPEALPSGRLTQNGLFIRAVNVFKSGKGDAERVRVFEKIRAGIWAYNGLFKSVDGWEETSGHRQVFKFKLELTDAIPGVQGRLREELNHDRVIPSAVKLAVWKRDKGRCVSCGSQDNLHFDHVIPYSQGGSIKSHRKHSNFMCKAQLG